MTRTKDSFQGRSAGSQTAGNGRAVLSHPLLPEGFSPSNIPAVKSKIAAAVLNVLAAADEVATQKLDDAELSSTVA
ncbi:MAG TPA: hypothetical protein VGB82_11905 [Alphaproteobacteria bacterium]